jgi:hypothetical protein
MQLSDIALVVSLSIAIMGIYVYVHTSMNVLHTRVEKVEKRLSELQLEEQNQLHNVEIAIGELARNMDVRLTRIETMISERLIKRGPDDDSSTHSVSRR